MTRADEWVTAKIFPNFTSALNRSLQLLIDNRFAGSIERCVSEKFPHQQFMKFFLFQATCPINANQCLAAIISSVRRVLLMPRAIQKSCKKKRTRSQLWLKFPTSA